MSAWAIARYDLNLSSDEWLDMTPRQFYALRTRELERMRREEYLCGITAATVANYAFSPPKRPMSPEDFLIHSRPASTAADPRSEKPAAAPGDSLLAALQNLPAGAAIKIENA